MSWINESGPNAGYEFSRNAEYEFNRIGGNPEFNVGSHVPTEDVFLPPGVSNMYRDSSTLQRPVPPSHSAPSPFVEPDYTPYNRMPPPPLLHSNDRVPRQHQQPDYVPPFARQQPDYVPPIASNYRPVVVEQMVPQPSAQTGGKCCGSGQRTNEFEMFLFILLVIMVAVNLITSYNMKILTQTMRDLVRTGTPR